jgi:hypothetical protein
VSVSQFDRQAVARAELLMLQEQPYGVDDSIPAIGRLEVHRGFSITLEGDAERSGLTSAAGDH